MQQRRPNPSALGPFACALLLAVAGCAVPGHSRQPPRPGEPTAVKAFQSPYANESPSQPNPIKLASLQGPAESPKSAGLTLMDVVKESLDSDPKIRAGAEGVNQAGADLWTASLRPNPTLTTDGLMLPLTRPFTPDRTGGPPQFDAGLTLPLGWLLWGQRQTNMASARAGVDVASADFADLVRQRVAAAVAAYFDILEARALLQLARDDLEALRRLEKITQDRAKLGGVAAIEVDRIRISVLDSERELKRRQATLATAKAALQALLGRLQVNPNFDVDGSLEVQIALPPPPLEQAIAVAEEFRPDIVSLRLQVAKADADVHQARHKAWPEVTPGVGYTRQFQTQALGQPDANSYNLSVSVVVPLSDRNQGNIAKARSVWTQNQFNLQTQRAQLRSDVVQAVEDYNTAYLAVLTDAPERRKAAQNLRDRIEAANKAGGRPLIEVLDAQRAYRDTLRTITMDQSAYWKALYRLNATLGRQVLR